MIGRLIEMGVTYGEETGLILEVLKHKEKDNRFMMFTKSGVNVWATGTIYLGAILGTSALIGALTKNKTSEDD